MWSALSLIALLGGIGLVLAIYGRYSHARSAGTRRRSGGCGSCRRTQVPLTPAQRVTAWFFLVVAALFLLQNLLGGATAHYHAEDGGFFGIDLPEWLPYNLTRTWHLQLAIFFVATAYLAAGIFLAPLIAGREPRGQGLLSVRAARGAGGGRLRQPGRRGPQLPRAPAARAPGRSSGPRAGSTSTWAGSGCTCSSSGWSLWWSSSTGACGRRLAVESRGNLPWLFFYSALSIPAVLRGRPADPHAVHVRDRRLLAVLGRPPLGRGLPGAVHHDAGGLHLRAAGGRLGEDRHAADLLRRDALLGRRRGRHAAPLLLQRRAGGRTWPWGRSSRRPRSSR